MKKIYILFSLLFGLGLSQVNAQSCYAYYTAYATGTTTVQFMDSSWANSGNPTYSWSFGDGSSSNLANPIHTYGATGSYYACLTLTTTTGCSSVYCDTIVLGGTTVTPCNAAFNYWVDTNNIAYFNNYSANLNLQTYSWNFGDGSPASTAINPTHQYNTPGAYGVILTATTSNGATCTFYDTIYVNYCSAYFYATNTAGSGTVTFHNYSSAYVGTAYWWNFGDGSPVVYSKNATHTYTQSGTYTVTLSLLDSIFNCSSTYSQNVTIQLNTTPTCNAGFTVALDSSASFKVILYNTSSNLSSHTYFWDFGDGTTGSGRIPQHQYQNFGSYYVCLTITDNQLNCTSTFCDTVGMDSLGNLKSLGFGLEVREPISVGIEEEQSIDAISIYPNPTNSELNLDLGNSNAAMQIEILDMTGKLILQERTNGAKMHHMNIQGLDAGVYFMVITDGVNRRIEKILKTQ